MPDPELVKILMMQVEEQDRTITFLIGLATQRRERIETLEQQIKDKDDELIALGTGDKPAKRIDSITIDSKSG